ncbi:MAG: hypothetical protein ALECFALPRED_006523 [Alectoria fallacina]|uniref:Uncharacterized protein n=1 Tax=Alectoria fallacina TaxID=1903189 RepID=A0A8H3G2X5_9LECA|nr:MAG: hypothetical protein ALECFALPRED_006523 [Alectoria fallacina]
MTEEEFADLTPSDPLEEAEPYEAGDYPDSDPPHNVWDLEDSVIAIELWFKELQKRKESEDGCGCVWPESSPAWTPREMFGYEDLHGGSRMPGVTTLHPRPKARIMIAHFNTNTMELDVKRSKFEQFNGFEAKEDKGNTGGRARPHNFETKGTFSSDGSIRFFK